MRDRDKIVKEKGKEYADNKRKARCNEIQEGNYVYVKRQRKDHKLNTDYSSEMFKVVRRTGPEVTVKSLLSGHEFKRYVSHLKKAEIQPEDSSERSGDQVQAGLPSLDTESQAEVQAENHGKMSDANIQGPEKRTRLVPKKFQDYVPF